MKALRTWTYLIVFATTLFPVDLYGADANEPNLPNAGRFRAIVWPNVADTVFELRLGGEWDKTMGLFAAPRYDRALAEGGDIATGLRLYATYNAIDAELAARWLHAETPLPAGALYAGLFGGSNFHGDNMEGGWLLGGALEMAQIAQGTRKERVVLLTSEWQYQWTKPAEQESRSLLVTGLKIPLW
jgi:hypothetical protein